MTHFEPFIGNERDTLLTWKLAVHVLGIKNMMYNLASTGTMDFKLALELHS